VLGKTRIESAPDGRRPISLAVKRAGEPSAGNGHAGFEVAGAGNQLTVRIGRHSQRKRGANKLARTYGAMAPVLDPTGCTYGALAPVLDPTGQAVPAGTAARRGRLGVHHGDRQLAGAAQEGRRGAMKNPDARERMIQGRRVTQTQSSVKAFSEGWIRANE